MLLFFFMVATVMRDSTLMVKNQLPAAIKLKLDKKDRVMYIYAGSPQADMKSMEQPRIQLNDKFASVSEVTAFVYLNEPPKDRSYKTY